MSRPGLAQRLALSALAFKYGPAGWRVFVAGRTWCAQRHARDFRGRPLPCYQWADAPSPAELAAKLRP